MVWRQISSIVCIIQTTQSHHPRHKRKIQMFLKTNANRPFAYANDVHAANRDVAYADSFTSLMSNAFVVMFDNRTEATRKRREVEKRRDADFDRFVDQHSPFTRYLP